MFLKLLKALLPTSAPKAEKPSKPSQASPVAAFVKERKAQGVPLWVLHHELWDKASSSRDMRLANAYQKAADTIEDVMVHRNLNGKNYERDGDERRAITQYEANVKDRFDGSHPYERLRIIYTRLGRNEDVIRVCEAYIQSGQQDEKTKAKYTDILRKLRPS